MKDEAARARVIKGEEGQSEGRGGPGQHKK